MFRAFPGASALPPGITDDSRTPAAVERCFCLDVKEFTAGLCLLSDEKLERDHNHVTTSSL